MGYVLLLLECWGLFVAELFWTRRIALSESMLRIFLIVVIHNFLHHRETTLGVYIFTMIGMFIYTFTLSNGHISVVYFTSALLGFFMTGSLANLF